MGLLQVRSSKVHHVDFSFIKGRQPQQIFRSRTHIAKSSLDRAPEKLKNLVSLFSAVPDPKIKYQQLLFIGKKLPPFPEAEKNQENKVEGCVSQVWLISDYKDGKLFWKADSDSALTKGLAALLVQAFDGCEPEVLASLEPDFISEFGFSQSMTPSRNNGFLNMFLLMKSKAYKILVTSSS